MSDSEEEVLVFVDFSKTVLPPAQGTTIKMIGLESESPIVQFQKQTFRGEWSECFGTKILLTPEKNPEPVDAAFSPIMPQRYEFSQSTTKILKLEQYVLNPRDPANVCEINENFPIENEESKDTEHS